MTLTPYLQASIYWTSSLSRPQNPGYWHWARAKSMQVLKNVGLAFASSRELQHKSRHAPMQHCHCHFMGYLLFEDFFYQVPSECQDLQRWFTKHLWLVSKHRSQEFFPCNSKLDYYSHRCLSGQSLICLRRIKVSSVWSSHSRIS